MPGAMQAAARNEPARPPGAGEIADDVRRALAEDVGSGDLTASLLPAGAELRAAVVCREDAVLCGTPWFDEVYRQLDRSVSVTWQLGDGADLLPGTTVCTVAGPAAAMLTGERTALNFLQLLSGTATVARTYAQAVAGTGVRILDTRKTLPGLRRAQKYAVRCGGCDNHRLGLHDAILIKENHIAAAGSITAAVEAARRLHPGVMVEVEVENLAELDTALAAGADQIMLDNFAAEETEIAVRVTAGRARLEISGNVELEGLAMLARSGVDFISIGALTKHVRAVDFSMRYA